MYQACSAICPISTGAHLLVGVFLALKALRHSSISSECGLHFCFSYLFGTCLTKKRRRLMSAENKFECFQKKVSFAVSFYGAGRRKKVATMPSFFFQDRIRVFSSSSKMAFVVQSTLLKDWAISALPTQKSYFSFFSASVASKM